MSRFTDRIDTRFAYVPAAKTDIRKTIARELRRLAELKAKEEAVATEAQTRVRPIKKGVQA